VSDSTGLPSSLASLDLTAQAALVRSGEVSARDLLDAVLDLLEGAGSGLGAVTDTDLAAARTAADRVDQRRRAGDELGPFAGVPITVKGSYDAAGLRTHLGRIRDSHVAASDAPVVGKARAAGAVVYGKTNVPDQLADYQTFNDDFGRTYNPWDRERTPGGSSGGASAALAAGLTALEFGSDLAGSIRMPAAWCGLFGHRPSNFVMSKMGHLPWEVDGELEPTVSTTGPLTRSARDLVLAVDVLSGPARLNAIGWRLELPATRVERLAGTRVGLWLDDEAAPIDDEQREALVAFAGRLRDAGCEVDEVRAPAGGGFAGLERYDRMQAGEIAHSVSDEEWAQALIDAAGDEPGAAFARSLTQPARVFWQDLEEQRRITKAWNALFQRVDVVLAPTVPGAAPLFDPRPTAERTLEIAGSTYSAFEIVSTWSRLANLAMLPSTVIPLGPGAISGQPLGAQLLGPYLGDRTTLRVAELLEQDGLIGFVPPPGW